MNDVMDRPLGDATPIDTARLGVVDCDIHPALRSGRDLMPFLSSRWQAHLANFGSHVKQPILFTTPYPRSAPSLARRDAWPPAGGPPGSDLAFMREQHLDALDVTCGILQVLDMGAAAQHNLEFGAAAATAINDWQLETWARPEPRLKGSIIVPQDDAAAAVAEIERRATDRHFVQVNVSPRSIEPLGRRRYWPIYEAATAAGLPIGVHVGGYGGHAPTASGFPSFYTEEHHSNAHTMQAQLTSLIVEGVPERFPRVKFIFIEGGFGWVPAMAWRLDKHLPHFREEVPHLRRLPSEYVREHFWFTTQPIEEPDRPRELRAVMEWIGFHRILFSSDYPHWDFDDPRTAIKCQMSEAERAAVFRGNATALYRLG
jgi:predicted TIM-barrel fold metal-dependent hydrolase